MENIHVQILLEHAQTIAMNSLETLLQRIRREHGIRIPFGIGLARWLLRKLTPKALELSSAR